MEDKEKKGSYKKKGSAQESNAQEASNDVNDMEGGMKNAGDVAGVPKKKGAAAAKTGGGEKEMTAKELKAEGKKLKQQARDKKKADRKSARATKKSDRKTKKSQKLQDKIDLQTLKGEQKLKSGDVVSSKAKRDRVEKLKTKKEKLDGAAKKKGSADFKGGLHAKNTKHSESGEHLGAKRMGFTQNFGAARQNSYAQGAAKVASIMSFGASKKKGVADHIVGHPASEVKLDNIAPSGGIKTSDAKQYIKDLIKSQSEYDVNTTQTSQNLAELDSLKMVASGNAQKAKSLYGYQYTSDKELNTNFDKSAYDPHMRGHSNPHGKKRSDKYKQLRKDAKVIQGPRPTL